MFDYKDWTQHRAEELAQEKHSKDLFDLPEEVQQALYNQATDDYNNYYAARIDAAYEAELDRRMGL